jgi:hypothetical protein
VHDEYLTVADVAERLQLNQQAVRNWITPASLRAFAWVRGAYAFGEQTLKSSS